jgi:molybdenum cofactor synthesis domain-containing protein
VQTDVTAAILLIGDEILAGKVADENAAFLIAELRALGVALRRILVIPDELDTIATSVADLSARFTHVFTSGGVGPTHDDRTMEGVARAFGMKVVRHPELDRLLRGFYGAKLEERNLRMADLPDGAELVAQGKLPWPVIKVRNVYVMPGVPIIFRKKFDAIREDFRQSPYHLRQIYLSCDEGPLAAHLDRVVAEFPTVACGSYPRFDAAADYRVKVTLESKDGAEVDRARDALVGWLPTDWLLRQE